MSILGTTNIPRAIIVLTLSNKVILYIVFVWMCNLQVCVDVGDKYLRMEL